MKLKSVVITFLILLTVFFIHCTKGTEPPSETGYKRTVVIEMFVYHDCPNCPAAEKAVDSLFKIHGDSLIVIEYHKKVFGDTLSPCSDFVNDREVHYNVTAYPTVVFDGVESHVGGTGDLFNTFLNYITDRFSEQKKSDLKIETFQANFVNSPSVSFNISISSDKGISGKLFIVLTEDSIVFRDSLYNFVAKQVFPNDDGLDFSVSKENPFGTSGSIPLSWQSNGDVWLNIFVQNISNNTIYQGGSINLGKVPLPSHQFDFSISPDTLQQGTPGQFTTFHFLIENTGNEDDSFYIIASEVNHIQNWFWQMCSGGLCKIPDHGIATETIHISSQEVDSFEIDVLPDSTPGTEKINVEVTSLGDTTLIEAMDIYTEVQ